LAQSKTQGNYHKNAQLWERLSLFAERDADGQIKCESLNLSRPNQFSFPRSHIKLNKRSGENQKRKAQHNTKKKENKSKGNQQQWRQRRPQMTNLSLNLGFGQKGKLGKDGPKWVAVKGAGWKNCNHN